MVKLEIEYMFMSIFQNLSGVWYFMKAKVKALIWDIWACK